MLFEKLTPSPPGFQIFQNWNWDPPFGNFFHFFRISFNASPNYNGLFRWLLSKVEISLHHTLIQIYCLPPSHVHIITFLQTWKRFVLLVSKHRHRVTMVIVHGSTLGYLVYVNGFIFIYASRCKSTNNSWSSRIASEINGNLAHAILEDKKLFVLLHLVAYINIRPLT